ncbi:MAG TPA: DNA-directed DNA polymerase II small subunit [Methanotrichaceae archaeon]|nr:DNA-directed DNA polymerase II small subunit [Methanotrichaceae archaeon]
MLEISRPHVGRNLGAGRDIVKRFAEEGYQLEPEALAAIHSYHGSRDDLIRRIISSLDASVAVIRASHVSGLMAVQARASPLPRGQGQACASEALERPVFTPARLPVCLSVGTPPAIASSSPGVVLKGDITGKSTCIGEYSDFVSYFRDRYSKIREILSRRLNSRPIESLGRSTAGREVSLIGMVMDVRSTSRGNRVVELEDPTGMITAIIQKDSEIYDQSSNILPDEVLGLTGVSDGSGRIFVKSLMWPDMPNQTQPLEKGDGYALLLSDLHVGSKYFMEDAWQRFAAWLNEEDEDPSGMASQVKYLVIAGDVADGIGIYPGQEGDLEIKDIYEQYEAAAGYINSLRKGLSIVISPGNHDIVRQAEPQPALPESVQRFFKGDILFVGNPAWLTIGGTSLLVYHGRSIDDLVLRIPGLSYAAPEKAMIEMLKRRHLSPVYGSRVSIAPEHEDHYVISRPPAILHCGHVHTVGIARYKGVAVINSGTWQSQTDFQKKMNIQPHPAAVPIVDLATMKVRKLLFA